ncbi:unnamed protein product [Linum trigynum]|uniref:Uncharacterized protein n=1 Tax=Linum trigynum TaxID=586398 RepID=A0AAV2EDH1_9ROSI
MVKESVASATTAERLRDDLPAGHEVHESLANARDEAQKEAEAWDAKLSADLEAEWEKIKATVEKTCQERYEAECLNRDLAEYHKFEVGKNLQADIVIDTVMSH